MQTSLNTSKWYQEAWAALIFFTRLPFWRVYQPPRESYRAVVEYWPLVGWLTGGLISALLYFGSEVMPYPLVVLIAILFRMMVTGALHEDGLADFFDGFGGGGHDRERILSIMKDSHIGTYGVLGLIGYVALLFTSLHSIGNGHTAAFLVLAIDPFSKMLAGQIIQMMPYARRLEDSKAKVVYRKVSIRAGILLAIQGLAPGIVLYLLTELGELPHVELLLFVPCIVMYFLYRLIWNRLRGYTGDCCGALCLLIELSAILTAVILL